MSNDFYMMTTEVTQGMFQEDMDYDSKTVNRLVMEMAIIICLLSIGTMAAHFANTLGADEGEQACYGCTGSGTSVTCSEAMNTIFVPNGPCEHEWELA